MCVISFPFSAWTNCGIAPSRRSRWRLCFGAEQVAARFLIFTASVWAVIGRERPEGTLLRQDNCKQQLLTAHTQTHPQTARQSRNLLNAFPIIIVEKAQRVSVTTSAESRERMTRIILSNNCTTTNTQTEHNRDCSTTKTPHIHTHKTKKQTNKRNTTGIQQKHGGNETGSLHNRNTIVTQQKHHKQQKH